MMTESREDTSKSVHVVMRTEGLKVSEARIGDTFHLLFVIWSLYLFYRVLQVMYCKKITKS